MSEPKTFRPLVRDNRPIEQQKQIKRATNQLLIAIESSFSIPAVSRGIATDIIKDAVSTLGVKL